MSRVRCYLAEPVSPDHWESSRYYHPETREIVSWYGLPVGALVEDTSGPGTPGSDGKMWICKTPGGAWCIDRPSKGGGSWSRTGVAPDLSVSPSIHITTERPLYWDDPNLKGTKTVTCYHGFLVGGWLESTSDSPT